MASLFDDQYYSDCTIFSNALCDLPTPITSSEGSACSGLQHAHHQVNLPSFSTNNFNINGALTRMVRFDSSDISSPASMSAFLVPDRLGVSDHVTTLPDNYHSGLFPINAGISEGVAGNYQLGMDEVGEECTTALDSNFWPPYPMTGENWEIQGGHGMAQRVEDSTLKITRYSAEERKDRILRYLKKRSQRNFNKTIKYACRKTLADKRVRVRGRFAKNNEYSDDDQTIVVKTDHINLQEAEQSPCYSNDDPLLQMKPSHEEEWLQEAIASLMYYRMLPDSMMELPADKYLS